MRRSEDHRRDRERARPAPIPEPALLESILEQAAEQQLLGQCDQEVDLERERGEIEWCEALPAPVNECGPEPDRDADQREGQESDQRREPVATLQTEREPDPVQ